MSPSGPDSPLRLALLRVAAFAALVEAVCIRLLPRPLGPAHAGRSEWLGFIDENTAQSGSTAFVVSLVLCLSLLMGQTTRALGRRPGDAWRSGLVAGGLMALITISLSAALIPVGPAFVAGFTLLALVIVILVIGQRYAGLATGWQRCFAVLCAGAASCSALSQLAQVGAVSGSVGMAIPAEAIRHSASGAALLLAAAAGACSYLAWMEAVHETTRFGWRSLEGAVSGAGSLAFAAICIFPVRGSAISALPEAWPAVAAASACLFLAGLTALSNIFAPGRARVGYGLLFMILAGIPLRTVLQNLMLVLGCLLLFEAAPDQGGSEPGPV